MHTLINTHPDAVPALLRTVFAFGFIGTLLLALQPLIEGLYRAAGLFLRRRAASYAYDTQSLHDVAAEAQALQPALAAELLNLSGRS